MVAVGAIDSQITGEKTVIDDEGKFFQALCTFRANTNDRHKHLTFNLDVTFQEPLTISLWLEVFEHEKLMRLANPELWHLSYFQVLQRDKDGQKQEGTKAAIPPS
jgi:hypothetical protein